MKKVLIIILILLLLFIIRILFVIGIISLSFLEPTINISGIENYNKNYYIKKYENDLDSNLSIFPNNSINMQEASFSSSFKTNLFDSDGYILLITKYSIEDFNEEIDRLSKINITINDCNGNYYTNYIKYDISSYKYPSYIAIDGFASTYEYALIDETNLQIIYIYLSYPSINNQKYSKYLKIDKSQYQKTNTINMYSIYNHTFDDGTSFIEYNDCQ